MVSPHIDRFEQCLEFFVVQHTLPDVPSCRGNKDSTKSWVLSNINCSLKKAPYQTLPYSKGFFDTMDLSTAVCARAIPFDKKPTFSLGVFFWCEMIYGPKRKVKYQTKKTPIQINHNRFTKRKTWIQVIFNRNLVAKSFSLWGRLKI